MPVERSAGCVVFRRAPRDPEFLLLKTTFKTTFWKPPKGLVEEGEQLEEAALREAREETGLSDLCLVPGFKQTVDFFYRKEGQTIKKFVTYFLAEARSGEAKVSEEHEECAWLPADEAIKRATHETDKQVLRKAVHFLKQQRLA